MAAYEKNLFSFGPALEFSLSLKWKPFSCKYFFSIQYKKAQIIMVAFRLFHCSLCPNASTNSFKIPAQSTVTNSTPSNHKSFQIKTKFHFKFYGYKISDNCARCVALVSYISKLITHQTPNLHN